MVESSEKASETSNSEEKPAGSDPKDRRLFAYLSLLGLFAILLRTTTNDIPTHSAELMATLAYCFAGIVGAYIGAKFAVEGFGKR